MKPFLFAAFLPFLVVGTAAAEYDCKACKLDHETICADECRDKVKSLEMEGCIKKCINDKCRSECSEPKSTAAPAIESKPK